MLVFLPGQAEIGRTAAALASRLPAEVVIQPLHGGLPFAAQRAALAPLAEGRKLVLATAIAETSLTIPEVRVVVDAGRARRARFDPGSGMTRLVTERVTRAEAEQRRGRAGRVAPGWCFRLWTRGEEGGMAAFPPPEIASADLAGLALELAVWGAASPDGLAFLTPPPAPAFAEARALLADLGALDARRARHRPRAGARPAAGAPAARAHAARRGRRGGRRARRRPRGAGRGARPVARPRRRPRAQARRAAAAATRRSARSATRRGGCGGWRRPVRAGALSPGAALSLAYPDRIAQRRPGLAPRYLLANGKGAALPTGDPLGAAPFLVAADLDGDPREATIRLGLGVTEADLSRLHGPRLRRETVSFWSRRDAAVLARERLTLGAIVLEDRPWRDVPPEAVAAAMADGIRDLGLDALPWTPATRRLAARVEWLRAHGAADLPDFSDAALLAGLDDWLGPWLAGMSRAADLARVDLAAALDARLGREGRQRLDRLAPAAIEAPTGTRLAIDYGAAAPTVSVRLQEMFGVTRHPTVGADAVPLVVELLSPAGRPVQTTADLPGFWRTSYAEVRRDLRGRYPRHPWPEDPAAAEPTRRAKPRGS